ncbi:MAG: dihydroneopterin aldolase [Proteobacteria bacterium]|nr:dihydroneopterin aldolase [Pseudomonadota bacterium]
MLIKIKNLRLKTILGVHAWEENIDREIIINAEIETNQVTSHASDNIDDTIDYDEIIFKIKNLVKSKRFKLIEKMTAEIMQEIMQDKRISRCKIEVDKVGVIADVDSFSVTLESYGS